jgi:magnesium transporter
LCTSALAKTGEDILHHAYSSHATSMSSPSLANAPRSGSIRHRFPNGLNVPNLKKRGNETRNWIRVEAASASV